MSLNDTLKRLPVLDTLYELVALARRNSATVANFTARSGPQYAYSLINVLIDEYLDTHLYRAARYAESGRLNRHEYQVFSQNGEDGLIAEIFRRIGTTNSHFVEFGVENGLETNTTHLFVKGWRGMWIEADAKLVQAIRESFGTMIQSGRLHLANAFVTAEGIEGLMREASIPQELDLLSIDIDGNDYWVWKAIENYRPRVVVVEYNATYRPDTEWIMKYDPKATWSRTSHYGASLKSLELLGRRKGYSLVGCNFVGVNAFFVRNDLIQGQFAEPFTAENHYEPFRLHLCRKTGHARGFGDFTTDGVAG